MKSVVTDELNYAIPIPSVQMVNAPKMCYAAHNLLRTGPKMVPISAIEQYTKPRYFLLLGDHFFCSLSLCATFFSFFLLVSNGNM